MVSDNYRVCNYNQFEWILFPNPSVLWQPAINPLVTTVVLIVGDKERSLPSDSLLVISGI